MLDAKCCRHELKYQIAWPQYHVLRQRLRCLMQPDHHADREGRYRILSLYFDNCDDKALREKKDGVNLREKFRIRRYNKDLNRLTLEKKQKINNLCAKSKAPLEPETCRLLLAGREWLPPKPAPLMSELDFRMKTQLLRPRTLVSYLREPYVYNPGNVRVTFDMDICTGMACTDFLNPDVNSFPVSEPGNLVLEVKFDGFLPAVIQDLLQLGNLRQCAFSKYAVCRSYE